MPGAGWRAFVEDEHNRIESAPGSREGCPAPGDASYRPGIASGHWCLQLTIEDAGPNDGDAAAGPNGVVRDPGGIGTPRGEVSAGEGGGALAPAALAGLFLSCLLLRRRLAAAGTAATLCVLLLIGPVARGDAFVGAGVGLSALDPETAGTPFSTVDDRDTGYKLFAGVDLTPISGNLAVEAFWADLGRASLSGGGEVDYSVYGAGLIYGIGSFRYPRLSAFVEAGVARLDIGANVPFRQEEETSAFFGIAGAFALRRHWFLQLEYDYYAKDAQLLSLSIVRRFRLDRSGQPQTYPLPPE